MKLVKNNYIQGVVSQRGAAAREEHDLEAQRKMKVMVIF